MVERQPSCAASAGWAIAVNGADANGGRAVATDHVAAVCGSADVERGAIKGEGGTELTVLGLAAAGQHRDHTGTKSIGVVEIENLRIAIEILLNPTASDDVNSAAAVGVGGGDNQFIATIVIQVGHQHDPAQIAAPALSGIGLNQQTAAAALRFGILQQRQVGRIGVEVAARQGIQPGGWTEAYRRIAAAGIGWIKARELNPDPAGGIAVGAGRERLGDGQPAGGRSLVAGSLVVGDR